MRLALSMLFLILGCALMTRRWWLPELDVQFDTLRLNLGTVLALVFGGLNLARWYTVQAFLKTRQTAVRYPLQRNASTAAPVDYNPEFDFSKQVDAGDNQEKRNE
jgi:hypothetical protein